MGCDKNTFLRISNLLLLLLSSTVSNTNCATVKDIFSLDTQLSARVPRDNKYYSSRYGSGSSNVSPLNRAIRPEDSPEARESTQASVEKRCTRCDSNYYDYRYPYESRSRYDDRRYRDRYDYDDRRYDRYDDRKNYDRYDDRYDRYDRRPGYERYDRYDRDRYDRDRYDRYDRDRYYDRDYDRGFGYDNRGYDYRDRGWDDRDYTSGGRRPESSYWGTSGGYASSWNYGDRDRYGGYSNRVRDPYDGYRTTSYLYGRPSSTTTNSPSSNSNSDNSVTQNPQHGSSSG